MEYEITDIANQIQKKNIELESYKDLLNIRTKEKVQFKANYEKELSKTIIRLRNNQEYVLEGQRIVNPPVSIIEKIAKGICWKELLGQEEKETLYKSLLVKIQITESQLNALQSIFKRLE